MARKLPWNSSESLAIHCGSSNKIADTKRNLEEIKKNWNDAHFEAFHKVVKEKLAKLDDQINRSKNLESVIKETEKDFEAALKELK